MGRVERGTILHPKVLSALTTVLNIEPQQFQELWVQMRHPDALYYRIERKDTHGRTRIIYNPVPALKQLQRRILSQILNHIPRCASYAGVKGRSYRSAAFTHLENAGQVLTVDIKHAFDSSRYHLLTQQLRPLLKSTLWVFALTQKERDEFIGCMAHLLTVQPSGQRFPSLPQGAPTSLATFNLIWAPIDAKIRILIHQLMPNQEVRYSRYVDDLVFSSNELNLDIIAHLKNMLSAFGYQLNEEKVRLATRDTAIVHGYCWQDNQTTVAPESYQKLVKSRGHLMALHALASTPNQQTRVAEVAHRYTHALHARYGKNPPASLLIDSNLLRGISPTPQWVDELWG